MCRHIAQPNPIRDSFRAAYSAQRAYRNYSNETGDRTSRRVTNPEHEIIADDLHNELGIWSPTATPGFALVSADPTLHGFRTQTEWRAWFFQGGPWRTEYDLRAERRDRYPGKGSLRGI